MVKTVLITVITTALLFSSLGVTYSFKALAEAPRFSSKALDGAPSVRQPVVKPRQLLAMKRRMQIEPVKEKSIMDSQPKDIVIVREERRLKFINAPRQLITPTYDGSGEAVHPSVIDFKLEYKEENWHGYRYWMAMTPYPKGYDAFENPSLLASQDGLTWVVPPGFGKPLDIKEGRGNFNSDPALVYEPEDKSLFVYWREYSKGIYEKLWRIKINASGVIGQKELCLEDHWTDKEGLVLSPTIWRKNAKEWYMWTANGNSYIHLYSSSDGKNWSSRKRCSTPWLNWKGGYLPWHLEAKPNEKEHRIEFFISGWPKNGDIGDLVLLYAEASMNDLQNLSMPISEPILKMGTAGNWDDDRIYKTSFTIEPEQSTYKYHVWYSARSNAGHWHTGYTEGSLEKN